MGLGAVMSVFGGMLFLTYAGKTLIMGMRHERAP